MRVIIQRVSEASVTIEEKLHSAISKGFLLLVGIEETDSQKDIDWLVNKILNMRIFNDEKGRMNSPILDINVEVLIVSQFTLFASIKKGNRPSFIRSAKPEIAIPLYRSFIYSMNQTIKKEVKTGVFGADMKVQLTNEGPVTILLDSKNKE
jgi:D-aminoacyl-tRNA deacylase